MARRFNMVSEQFPPLNANMATLGGAGNSNNANGQNASQAAQPRGQIHQDPVYFNHSISIRLNDHNFLLWKQQVLAAIKGNRLLKFIKETPPAEFLTAEDRAMNRVNQAFVDWEVQDQLLVSWLLSSMTESLLTRMVGCNSAQQIWSTLEKHFTLQVSSKILEFRTKLQNLRKGTLSLNDYLLKVKQTVDLLASVGEVLSDRDHVAAIFKGLPSEYDTFVISTNTRTEQYTVGEIEALLLASESRIEKSGKEIDLSANLVSNDPDSLMEANLAWRRFRQQFGRGNSQYSNTPSQNNQSGSRYFTRGDNNSGGRGNFYANQFPNQGVRSGMNMNNKVQCQLCLRLGHTAMDCFYRFDKSFSGLQTGSSSQSPQGAGSLKSQQTQANLTTNSASCDSSWYPDSGATNHCTPQAQNLANCYDYEGHDQMLGHPSEKIVQTVLKDCNIPAMNKDFQFSICAACCLGKIHKFPFPKASQTVISEPLQLVVSDLWGPSHTPSFNGYKYYIHFVDAYSRFTWIYLLKHKSDALKTFQHFKAEAELQLGKSIKTLQTDWGGEFRSFTNFLAENGIHHRHPCPTTHQQNGLAERKHRHIVENGLALLAQASLPLKFWDEAFRTAVYLHNRLPTPLLQLKSPLETLFHTKPDYTSFKTFGCKCYPNIRPYNKHKLEFRSSPCTFMGYSLNHKGYKCLDSNGRLYISRDVIFDEFSFPYESASKHSSPPPSHITPCTLSGIIPKCSHYKEPYTMNDLLYQGEPPAVPTVSNNVQVLQHVLILLVSKIDLDPSRGQVPSFSTSPSPGIPHTQEAAVQTGVPIISSSTTTTLPTVIADTRSPPACSSPAALPLVAGCLNAPALSHGWNIRQLDVNNAFLNGELQEEVYMQQPPGFEIPGQEHLVCKLNKALYGLKQAPQAWFDKLHQCLLSFGFVSSKSDHSLFINHSETSTTLVLVYVDDILITGSDLAMVDNLVAALNTRFSLRDLGPLKSIVGALQYITITRPELSFSVNKVCQFMQQPLSTHWQAVKRILREKVLQKLIQIKHVAAFDQIADGFTKEISSQRFSVFRDKLTIGTSPIMSLRGGVKDSNEDPNDS
uniref:Integrase catalytic domain-containing protein n=1 Tax=Cannabis sativa TaxID=3483 RepID=A0A803Q9W1_CANSA